MRPLISARELRKSFPGLLLFQKVDFDIFEGDKIGLVGPNGSGKTTLLRVLRGRERLDYGTLHARPGLRVGWLEQYQTADSDETVGAALSESEYSSSLRSEIQAMEERMAEEAFFSSPEYPEAMARYNSLQAEHAKFSGNAVRERAQDVLDALGGGDIRDGARIRELSGGERRKVALAKVLVAADSMDLLLLDEPMNHLDIEAVEWLEEFTCDFQGTVLVVSHDRYLLDDTVFRIFDLEAGRLRVYEGNYTDYTEQVAMREAVMARSLAKHESEQRRQKEIILKLRGRNRFDAQIRARLARLARMERPEDPVLKKRMLKFKFSLPPERGGRAFLTARGLGKAFNGKMLFEEADIDIELGWKVGLIGPNGCGKTTLLKMMVGEEPVTAGELHLSSVARVGYFDQGHLSLEAHNTLIEEIQRVDSTLIEDEAKGLLGRFHFKGEAVHGQVGKLSGGERARLAILKMVLSPCNLLVLDEPTNHLDLLSREAVERAVNTYGGTVITASHDRYFLDRTCDHIISMSRGHVRSWSGNYTEFRSLLAREVAAEPKERGPAYFVVRKGFTDWASGRRYRQGERIKLEPDELRDHGWALETKHLVKEGEQ